MKNLVIAVVGDSSCHKTWLSKKNNFDLALIYYGNDKNKAFEYNECANYFMQEKGNKFHLIYEQFRDFSA